MIKFIQYGSIYLSVNQTNPGTLFGGTWTRITDGFLYCISGNGGVQDNLQGSAKSAAASGNTGSTTLTEKQIPSHAHTLHAVNKNSNGYTPANDNNAEYELNFNQSITYGYPTKGWCNTVAMGAAGGGKGHTHTLNSHTHNIPYTGVVVWKRTA